MRRPLLSVVVAAVVLVGCTDDSDDSSADSPVESVPVESVPVESVPVEVTNADRPVTPITAPDTPLCNALVAMYAAEAELDDVDYDDPADVEQLYTTMHTSLSDLLAESPAEIAADVTLTIDAIEQILAVLEPVSFDTSGVDYPITEAMAGELDTAADRISAYGKAECGVLPPRACRSESMTLAVAVEAYLARNGEYPTDVSQLVDEELISELPQFHEILADGVVGVLPDAPCA